jgi:Flp pilus assembly protein TadD
MEMRMPTSSNEAIDRLRRLKSYLDADPGNLELLTEAADAALAAHDFAEADTLLAKRQTLAAPGMRERSMAGLAAMGRGDFAEAAFIYEALRREAPGDPALRFNLAWSLAMEKRFETALSLLDAPSVEALPQAAALHIQILHELGRHEEALETGKALLHSHPEDKGVCSAVSLIALDCGDRGLAYACAEKAGDHPDALQVLGVLALEAEEPGAAKAHFETALAIAPEAPRALIGRGLCRLVMGEAATGAVDIESGAQRFGDHAESWVAAGWARILTSEFDLARRHFERARQLAPNAAEIEGSLGILCVLQGDAAAAQSHVEAAESADRNAFTPVLARALLAQSKGDALQARALVERALSTPIAPGGKTLAHSLAKLGLFA